MVYFEKVLYYLCERLDKALNKELNKEAEVNLFVYDTGYTSINIRRIGERNGFLECILEIEGDSYDDRVIHMYTHWEETFFDVQHDNKNLITNTDFKNAVNFLITAFDKHCPKRESESRIHRRSRLNYRR